MKKIKVMPVFGTRPDAIKMAPLVLELKKRPELETVVCVSGQHRQTLDTVLDIFRIKPDFDLNVMRDRQTLTQITSNILNGMDEVLDKVKPDLVLVHGDTSTAFTAALAAFYHKIKIGHVEAGLRTYDKYSPFPEEMNRRFVGFAADLHFAPTKVNQENLLRESISPDSIYITGNTEVDAIYHLVQKDYVFQTPALRTLPFDRERIILMTAHRRENLGEPLEHICKAAKRITEQFPDTHIVYPVHLNPAVREVAQRVLGNTPRVSLIDPIGVDDMCNLLDRSVLVLTDSGGVQEDSTALHKPCLVLRTETERPEAIETGATALAGTEEDAIVSLAAKLLTDEASYQRMAAARNPYGDGCASERIADAILYSFGCCENRPNDFS